MKQKIRGILALILNVWIDLLIYLKESGLVALNTETKLLAMMTFNYHTIEKGLSMEQIRYGFGRLKVTGLLERIKKYLRRGYPTGASQFIAACSVLVKYYQLHQNNNFDISDFFRRSDYDLIRPFSNPDVGGSLDFEADAYFKNQHADYPTFLLSRHSIRAFSRKLVDTERIQRAVNLARHCPSACNRQSTKVYLVDNKAKIEEILKIQQGIDATADFIRQLLVVTGNRNYFFTSGERNQHLVDGGIFLQSLLMALHYEKIAACPLHWSLNYGKDKKIKELVGLNRGEKVIALVSIGNIDRNFKVPASKRKPLDEVFSIVD